MNLDASKPVKFVTHQTATFSEIDPFGHVNSQHYLAFYNSHRFQGMRETLNLGLKEFAQWPIMFPITEMHIKYYRPVFADQEFKIESYVSDVSEMECIVQLNLTIGDKLHSEAQMHLACVDKKTMKKTTWPQEIIQLFFELS